MGPAKERPKGLRPFWRLGGSARGFAVSQIFAERVGAIEGEGVEAVGGHRGGCALQPLPGGGEARERIGSVLRLDELWVKTQIVPPVNIPIPTKID